METSTHRQNLNILPHVSSQKVILLGLLLILLVAISAIFLPVGKDWHGTFRKTARVVLSGQSPYTVGGYVYAPWTVFPFLPLIAVSEPVGRGILFVATLVALGFTAYRLGASPLAFFAFLFSPPVVHGLLNANIDWLPILGFVLPPQVGLFLLAMKPQIGLGVGIFWLFEAYRDGGVREVVRVFAPVSTALLLSFLLFGLWPLRYEISLEVWWNASLWPLSIPIGLALLVAAVRLRVKKFAMAAGPFLSPYVLLHSYAGALLALAALPAEMLAAALGLWILVIAGLVG